MKLVDPTTKVKAERLCRRSLGSSRSADGGLGATSRPLPEGRWVVPTTGYAAARELQRGPEGETNVTAVCATTAPFCTATRL